MRPFRRRQAQPSNEKPYLVTIHAAGDQHHTFAMGPGDAVGVAGIRVDIKPDGAIHVSPLETPLAGGTTREDGATRLRSV